MRVRLFSLLLAFVLCQSADLSSAAEVAPIRVALFDDVGTSGPGVAQVTRQLGAARGIQVTKVKGVDIAAGRLKDFDVVIFTGGSASQQAKTLGDKGGEEIRRFVREGGGYVGICAGAYLACSGFDWSLGIINASTVSSRWQRGVGEVEVECMFGSSGWNFHPTFTEAGRRTSQMVVPRGRVFYENGPILKPAGRSDIPEYDVLAYFRTELAENDSPVGAMINSPAITRARFGKGRVLISSPHPEQTPWMEGFMEHAVRWVAVKEDASKR
jgi:glutamine amidotransferase-like uncharacterized protein